MTGTLQGDVVISVKDTQMPFRYLNALGADMFTTFKRLLKRPGEEAGTASIHCLVGDFSIKGGLANTDVLVADTERVLLSGNQEEKKGLGGWLKGFLE